MAAKITDLTTLNQKITQKKMELTKLEAELGDLRDKSTKLSGAYRNNMCYALAYDDGHGTIELFGEACTTPDALTQLAESRAKHFLGETLYVVGLEVKEYVKKIQDCK